MPFPGAGSGTPEDPYVITTVEELQAIKEDPSGYYVLANDIDASSTKDWNEGAGFLPLCKETPFTGSFDGRGHTIHGLAINRPSEYVVGLFARVEDGASIRDLRLSSVDIKAAGEVGAIAAYASNECVIEGCNVDGKIQSKSGGVGGLVGRAENTNISDCRFEGEIRILEGGFVGGIVGQMYQEDFGGRQPVPLHIKNLEAAVEIAVEGVGSYVGGLIGGLSGRSYSDLPVILHNSHAVGSIILGGTGNDYHNIIGGLVGGAEHINEIQRCTANVTIDTLGLRSENVGGLVGLVEFYYGTAHIESCEAHGDVRGGERVGGLIGSAIAFSDGEIFIVSSSAAGNITGEKDVGGLIGAAEGTTAVVRRCHATGRVVGSEQVGGLVGSSYGPIEDSYATGDVEGQMFVGGLAGRAFDRLINCRASGNVTASGDSSPVGGITSVFYGKIMERCRFDGEIHGTASAGGIAGAVYGWMTTLRQVCFTGRVVGGVNVGGLIGEAYDCTLLDAYSVGSVEGTRNVGGVLGAVAGQIIERVYAAGPVEGEENVGGLIGFAMSPVTPELCYWDVEVTGQETSVGGGIPKSTAEMKRRRTFAGWDFVNTWNIVDNVTYPFLRNTESPGGFGINIAIEGDGAVIKEPDRLLYEPGTEVKLTAWPSMGSRFARWSEDVQSREREIVVLVTDRNVNLTAAFIPCGNYLVDVAVDGKGDAVVAPAKDYYARGEVVAITPSPNTGWEYVGTSGTAKTAAAPARIVVRKDQDLTVHFRRIGCSPNVPEVEVDGRGFVVRSPNKDNYEPGEQITLTAIPEDGWYFAGWSGGATGNRNPLILQNAGQLITAIFRRLPKNVT